MLDRLAEVAHEDPERLVERALATAREVLDMDVAYISEIAGSRQVFTRTDGNAGSFAIEDGKVVPLDQSFCQRMLDGRIGNVVHDARAEPEVAQLAHTRVGNVGSYIGVPIEYSDGRVRGTLCCLSHEAKGQLADQEVRFVELLAQLVGDELERLELRTEADRLKDDFLALTTHDLKSPLTAIQGYVSLLRDAEGDRLSEDGGDMLDAVGRNVKRLDRLVSQLLWVAQSQAGRLPEAHAPVDLAAVVGETVSGIRPSAEAAGLTIEFDAPDPVMIAGDRDQLSRLADNLVSNAVKYSSHGGAVRVSVHTSGGAARLTVADSGAGIAPEDQSRLFERFFRTDDARAGEGGGAGLGLWIVRDVAERHGGSVAVESGLGVGSTFTVVLPTA
ncbi:MAG: GAF domain-containing sensor histidine kinase [Thermoleophilaceae bacterium]|nr:GAF domain-containing sensor histidine kinase [Thermoleophilaceae bacterium]